jgi:chaperonin GroEL
VKLKKEKLPFDRRTKTTPYYMEEHIEWLKSMIESEENSWLKEQYSNRLSRITSGISTIYVGGASEVEQIERKERVDDAVNACKSALESGVVVGGGATLYGAINHIVEGDGDADIFNLFCDALATPLKTIIGNSGQAGDLGDCRPNGYKLPKKSYFCGKTGHILKASEGGVYDPVMVVINSLESAVSIAALVLMTDAAIIAPDA